jgi:crotonobetainyl-CoA:carnitine CoA-transferase CaiB-like acyl-CoA transferase
MAAISGLCNVTVLFGIFISQIGEPYIFYTIRLKTQSGVKVMSWPSYPELSCYDIYMQPLEDIMVIDLSRVLAGPYCTMMLADMGAEVIKVEQPGTGDETRQWGPPFLAGESAYYLGVNRNKMGITLNLRSERGREILCALLKQADVIVENFKLGTMEAWGIDYETLSKLNPRLIYCNISGYGPDGPRAGLPGYDFIIQAEGGLMSITGPIEGPPMKVGVAIVDITAGMFAASAILAALHAREQTGTGQRIDVSLLESQVA